MTAPGTAAFALPGAFFVNPRKESPMKTSDYPELVPAPHEFVANQFATGDVAEGHDLKWRIMACFRSRIPDVQGIHVTVFGTTAVLRGKVPSLHEKRLYVECCRHVPGVMRVMDDLIVGEPTSVSHNRAEELP